MKKEATVKDVAREAGVSTATVSRVLNGDGKVRPETETLVRETIIKLDYRMNRIARSLKTNRTQTVGIMAPEFGNEFFMNIVTGIEEGLKQGGYSVILCSSRENREEEEIQLALLREKGVDGIIAIPGGSEGTHFNSVTPIPLVLVDRLTDNFTCDAVLADNYRGAWDSVSCALDDGAERIGFIGGDRQLSSARERFDGFKAALDKKGLELREEDVLFGDYHTESGYRLMKQLMEQENPPRHIFISNYFMHLGAARYLLERKSPIEGLHIISFDDMPLAAFFPYSSIIVAQPMIEMGRRAAELLMKRIKGDKEDFPRIIRMETSIRRVGSDNRSGSFPKYSL